MNHIGIIDYGMGNLNSIKKAVERSNGLPIIISHKNDLLSVDKIILPGVGAFYEGMVNLKRLDLLEPLQEISDNCIPLLGICLGMQLLGSIGEEGGFNQGLNLIEGVTTRLHPICNSERIPNVGWNEVEVIKDDPIFFETPSGSDFYFVHSYCFGPYNSDYIIGTTPYCKYFVSVVRRDNIVGVQFHPEKSGFLGSKMIDNFVNRL